MPEQSEGNNHTSRINVFPVLHTIFFLLAGQKVDLFAPHGAIKSTLWPASRKKYIVQQGGKVDHLRRVRCLHFSASVRIRTRLRLVRARLRLEM